ncbi:MAG TPA: spore germination protein [Symbiobacteriaceae bacterium]|nr:spore germination protein [Symbiobacteriaceae bacterium]
MTLPPSGERFIALLHSLFAQFDRCGVAVHLLRPPTGPALTVVFIADLIVRDDVERLILRPLSTGLPPVPLEQLTHTGLLSAPVQRPAKTPLDLLQGLHSGLAAIHVEGQEGALLVGSSLGAAEQSAFQSDLSANVAMLRRALADPRLCTEVVEDGGQGRTCLVYLHGAVSGKTLDAIRAWARQSGKQGRQDKWWTALVAILRLPQTWDCPSPAAAAETLRSGHVAVFFDRLPCAQIAPTTLSLLAQAPQDVNLPPALRRLLPWPRMVAALFSLTVSAGYVAVTSYHHSLIPGPFLIALASSRQNKPLPIQIEVITLFLLDDGLWAAAHRGSPRYLFSAAFATVLVATALLHAGIVGPATVTTAITTSVLMHLLPSESVTRPVRLWRYLFVGAAAGLGGFGMALIAFGLMAYLAGETRFHHPLRQPIEGLTA